MENDKKGTIKIKYPITIIDAELFIISSQIEGNPYEMIFNVLVNGENMHIICHLIAALNVVYLGNDPPLMKEALIELDFPEEIIIFISRIERGDFILH